MGLLGSYRFRELVLIKVPYYYDTTLKVIQILNLSQLTVTDKLPWFSVSFQFEFLKGLPTSPFILDANCYIFVGPYLFISSSLLYLLQHFPDQVENVICWFEIYYDGWELVFNQFIVIVVWLIELIVMLLFGTYLSYLQLLITYKNQAKNKDVD